MTAREAYDVIRRAIGADPHKRVLRSEFDEGVFGNFIIAFEDRGRPRSIVNDRFELVICDDLEGEKCRTVLRSLRDADEAGILNALDL